MIKSFYDITINEDAMDFDHKLLAEYLTLNKETQTLARESEILYCYYGEGWNSNVSAGERINKDKVNGY